MKYRKEWAIGGEKKDEVVDDYITAYIAENGMRIECKHGFSNWSDTWYIVNGYCFNTLKEAKQFIEGGKTNENS